MNHINTWLEKFATKWAAHDVASVMKLFTDYVEYWETPHAKFQNKAELEAEWQGIASQEDVELSTKVFSSTPDGKHTVLWQLKYTQDGEVHESAGTYLISLNDEGVCDYFMQTFMPKNPDANRGVVKSAGQVDYLYRVSIRAVIRNHEGRVLAVKEHGDVWHLPGGGMDYGETIHDCLARELREETGFEGEFTYTLTDSYVEALKRIDAEQLVLIAELATTDDIVVSGDAVFVDESEVADLQYLKRC